MSQDNGQLRAEQLAPHSVEAEEAVLGAVLINPDALFEVLGFLNTEDFFIVRHAWIYEALIALHERRDPIDYLTVVAELEQVGRLAETGGAAYILKIINHTPSSLNCEGYGRIVERMAIRRRLLDAAGQIARVSHSEETDIDEVINQSEQAVFEVTDRRMMRDYKPMRTLVSEALDDYSFRERHKNSVDFPGPKFHLADLDSMMGMLFPGKLYIEAGRPGMGKSALLHGAAAEIGKKEHVAFFSLEMDTLEITNRILSRYARIDGEKIRDANMDEKEYLRYLEATEGVARLHLHIDDTPGITIQHMKAKLRRWCLEYGICIAFVDYLQLMEAPEHIEKQGEVKALTYISKQLKIMAREFRIPIVAAAQLNRAVEERANKRPLLSDLRGSGSLEQDADAVLFLYRDEYYDDNSPDKGIVEIRIAKHRGGKTGMKKFAWIDKYTMVANLQLNPNKEIKERVGEQL